MAEPEINCDSRSHDVATAASNDGVSERVEIVEEDDKWVEAEIERLLQGAIDNGEEDILQVHKCSACINFVIIGTFLRTDFTGSACASTGPAWG